MRLGDWLDERIGHRAWVRDLLDTPAPGGVRFASSWGAAFGATLLLTVVTGIALMTAYAPSTTTAWASLAHIQTKLSAGWLIRGLHQLGAQTTIALGLLHLVATIARGAYHKPREVNFWVSLALVGIVIALGVTGNPLRWDQRGYWALRVETGIIGTLPLVGAKAQELLMGGPSLGNATLTRLYALHVVVLPLLLGVLVLWRLRLWRRHGPALPAGAAPTNDRWYPSQAARDLLLSFLALGVVFALALRGHGVPLDAPADPLSDYPARPEWYFMALFTLRKPFPGSLEPIATAVIPGIVVLFLVALPLLDKRAAEGARRRLSVLVPAGLIGVGAVVLTLVAMRADAGDAELAKAVAKAEARAARAKVVAQDGVPPEGALAMMRVDPETRGPELFSASCASCHKLGDLAPPEGKLTAPDLTGFGTKAWVMKVLDDPDAAHLFGNTPFKTMMPSMVKPPSDPEAAKSFTPMTAADQEAVAVFLEAQARGERAEGTAGEKIVKLRCTDCHRLDGKNTDEDSLAPELRGWASAAWLEAQIADPGSGRTYPAKIKAGDQQGMMPAYADKMSAADRKLLVTWLMSQRSAATPK